MKSTNKFRNAFLVVSFCLLNAISYAQVQNNVYGRIDVFNPSGQNPHDFVFSYDIINGTHSCINNFEIINNFNVATSFRFQILINETLTYTGQVDIPAFGSVFFNDAFTNCNSVSSRMRIIIL